MHPPTGYSKAALWITRMLESDGHVVGHIPSLHSLRYSNPTIPLTYPYVTREGEKAIIRRIPVFSSSLSDEWGENVVWGPEEYYYRDFDADMVVTAKDTWAFNRLPEAPVNWVPMTFEYHEPLSPHVSGRLKFAFQVIAVSHFGVRVLRKAGIPSNYIPLGVDVELYKPLPDRKAAKRVFHIPGDHWTAGIVAMNRNRKMIPRLLRCCVRFRENNPDVKFAVLLWTDVRPNDQGTDLNQKIRDYGMEGYVYSPEPKLYNTGLPEERMPELYNAMDVLLCGSAEGYWMPGAEGGSCGTPAVVAECGAAGEVVGAGYQARVSDWEVWNPIGVDLPLVDIDDFAVKMERLFNQDEGKLRERARRYALRFDWRTVYDKYWRGFLDKCELLVKPKVTNKGLEHW